MNASATCQKAQPSLKHCAPQPSKGVIASDVLAGGTHSLANKFRQAKTSLPTALRSNFASANAGRPVLASSLYGAIKAGKPAYYRTCTVTEAAFVCEYTLYSDQGQVEFVS